MNINKLENFAKLAVEVGVNLQPGEDLVINSPIEDPNLARLITKAAYEKGARKVSIDWNDPQITRMNYQYQDSDTLNEVTDWQIQKVDYQTAQKLSNKISIHADDPDMLKGLDAKKIADSLRSLSLATKKYKKYTMSDIISWLVISYPTKKWAKKVFPSLSEQEAVEKLWELIFNVTRIDENWQKTKENWTNHIDKLEEKAKFLNQYQFDKLHYTSKNGTNLWVELPKDHLWISAGSHNEKGDFFVPNMPTEEVFSAPKKTGVNGKLVATKPLVYNGVIINDFDLTFKDGKVVDFSAKEGYDTLSQMLESDPNARYLGEIALVAYDSPISNSNVLFYNTLFDENASCHFAFGQAYPTNVKGASGLNDSELEKVGLNSSLIHVDFMVGSSDLNIKGYKDDKEVSIFVDGNWA